MTVWFLAQKIITKTPHVSRQPFAALRLCGQRHSSQSNPNLPTQGVHCMALVGNLLGTVDGVLGTVEGLLGGVTGSLSGGASGGVTASAGGTADLSHTL